MSRYLSFQVLCIDSPFCRFGLRLAVVTVLGFPVPGSAAPPSYVPDSGIHSTDRDGDRCSRPIDGFSYGTSPYARMG